MFKINFVIYLNFVKYNVSHDDSHLQPQWHWLGS